MNWWEWGPETEAAIDQRRDDYEDAQRYGRRLWALMMIARDRQTWQALARGQAVKAGQLEPIALHRALRGKPLPPAETYGRITPEQLDAVAEAGTLALPRRPMR